MHAVGFLFVELVTRWKRNVAWFQKIAFCYLDGKGEGAPGIVIYGLFSLA